MYHRETGQDAEAASTPRLAECVGSPTDSYQDWTAQDTTGRDHTTSSLDVELQCKYPSRNCAAPRAVKKTGDLHSFCEFHRAKANQNQRRLEHRRRVERAKRTRTQPPPPPKVNAPIMPRQTTPIRIEWVDLERIEPHRSPMPLQVEDFEVLLALLHDDASQ